MAPTAPRVALLLGKPVERSPVLPDVVTALRAAGADVRIHVPGSDPDVPRWLRLADVVALRGLSEPALEAAVALEARGVHCCNTPRATLAVRDRLLVQRALEAEGLPVPPARKVSTLAAAQEWAGNQDYVLKDLDGSKGRGAGVWRPSEGEEPPFAGPYLAQRWAGDGIDRKLYVIGDRVAGLLKPRGVGRRTGERFDPGAQLEELSQRAGTALGLEIFGVDLVAGECGAMIVDVNAFPSCNGVAGAAEAMAQHLLNRAGRPKPQAKQHLLRYVSSYPAWSQALSRSPGT